MIGQKVFVPLEQGLVSVLKVKFSVPMVRVVVTMEFPVPASVAEVWRTLTDCPLLTMPAELVKGPSLMEYRLSLLLETDIAARPVIPDTVMALEVMVEPVCTPH